MMKEPVAPPSWSLAALPAWLRALLAPSPAALDARAAWWRHLADLGAGAPAAARPVPRTPGARRRVAG